MSATNGQRKSAIYVRVSSNRQDTESQERELRRWVEKHDGPVRWYREIGSGKTMGRPIWGKIEEEMRRGQIDQIVVWRLDRLGRTVAGLTALFDRLLNLKVRLVSLRDGLDLTTSTGRLIANVLASVAAYENEVLSERIRAGQAAARARGVKFCGGKKGRCVTMTSEKVRAVHRLYEAHERKAPEREVSEPGDERRPGSHGHERARRKQGSESATRQERDPDQERPTE